MLRSFGVGGLVASVVLAVAGGASAQVVIQGEGQVGGVYGQGSVYVEPQQGAPVAQPVYGQPQPVYGQPGYGQPGYVEQPSPYVAQPMQQRAPVRTIVHSAPTTALLVPGVLALGAGWLIHGIASVSVFNDCDLSPVSSCPRPVGEWAALGWIPLVGPWLAYGLIDHHGDYAWMNILFGVIQDVGAILMVLGLAIQQEWEEAIYADLGDGVTLGLSAGPTSVGANLRF